MQFKNFDVHASKLNIIACKGKKFLPFLIILIIFFMLTTCLYKISNDKNFNSLSSADFRLDLSVLTETANVIEIERSSNNSLQLHAFGSDGKIVDKSNINQELKTALLKIGDSNSDEKLSNEEINSLGITGLDINIYKKKIKILKFNLISQDRNLKNYLIITKGPHAGTILYNGALNFIDDSGKHYLGLELSI